MRPKKIDPLWLALALVPACVTVVNEAGAPAGSSSTGDDPSGDGPDEPPTSGSDPSMSPEPTTDALSTSGGEGGGTGGMLDPTPTPECGNGIIEGDEACDNGWDANKPQNACDAECELAVCGDGDVQPGNGEQCDDGALNVAIPGYEQCSKGCLRGAHCGDGVLQAEAGEECEPSQSPENIHNCAAMCRLKPRVVFLTSESYTGAMGGTAGADKRCNALVAARPDLSGTFRAWLLVDGQTLADRFPEFIEPVSWSFTNTGAELLADSFAQLVAQGPASPILYTESGAAKPETKVWTNITATGTAAGGDCAQWTSTQGSAALIGHSGFLPDLGPDALKWHTERRWTDYIGWTRACTELLPIYCIQVSD